MLSSYSVYLGLKIYEKEKKNNCWSPDSFGAKHTYFFSFFKFKMRQQQKKFRDPFFPSKYFIKLSNKQFQVICSICNLYIML